MREKLARLIAVIIVVTVFVPAVSAIAAEEDKARVQAVITGQIEAFLQDDAAGAYSYAAPVIRRTFPTPEAFIAMVRRGYSPVYRPQSYSFGQYGMRGDTHIQSLDVIGPDGQYYVAVYTLMETDGGFVITGCYIKPAQGV
ncbi:MAG: DUF4864 domain-containing protein [Tepidamorphaceae bacterium]|nr:DUF4864 domain-containing protein [Rhodobiaceae bacterium]MCC0048854.1 DUF4864 domain-containing protein [Rhodobiaceae bacterium]